MRDALGKVAVITESLFNELARDSSAHGLQQAASPRLGAACVRPKADAGKSDSFYPPCARKNETRWWSMIMFGNGWSWLNGHLHHACGPDVVRRLQGERACRCGASVPVHAQTFQRWIRLEIRRAEADPDLRALLIASRHDVP